MFKVYLANNQVITEKECLNWNLLPQFPIVKFEYLLPNKKILTMEGFDSYCFIKEFYHFLYKSKGKKLDTINILASYGKKVYQFSLQMRKGKALQCVNAIDLPFRPVKVIPVPTKDKRKEYYIELQNPKSINSFFWHSGVKLRKQRVEII